MKRVESGLGLKTSNLTPRLDAIDVETEESGDRIQKNAAGTIRIRQATRTVWTVS